MFCQVYVAGWYGGGPSASTLAGLTIIANPSSGTSALYPYMTLLALDNTAVRLPHWRTRNNFSQIDAPAFTRCVPDLSVAA
jgi:hypothetical protein